MRLTKLELHGFKSFADLTNMVFEPGVTAIVGPNGCGKSNVSDAVRWVLGEQRARLLRGAKMEEVIFQGTTARRAVNLAEVSLYFENEDGALPVPFKEVVITRRLSRSGESDYLLNRTPCRLRDIHDMLRGTGLAADSGVVIEAKMIDALLSDRPDDRRELFEEAAGVGLYRDRRRTTERRLEETTVDLQRLDDLLSEVQSQVRSLSRQRKRAERHVELSSRRFNVEVTLAGREMAAWHEELGRLETRIAVLREQLPACESDARAAEAARDAAHGARTAAEGRRAELARLVNAQREHLLQLQSEIAVAAERQRNAEERRQRAEEERREGEAYGVRIAAERQRSAEERAACETVLNAASEALATDTAREEEARRSLAATREAVERAERALREAHDALRALQLDSERAQRELDEVAARIAALDEERAQLDDAATTARREHADGARGAEEATAAAEVAVAEQDASRESAREARERESAARSELFRADEAHTALQGRVNALETLERERVGLAPAAAQLLKERSRFGDGGVLGPLSDFIETDQGAAIIVERFLGATVHAVLVRDASVARSVRDWHAAANPGPLLLLPVDAMPAGDEAGMDGQEALARLVSVAAPARGWIQALLGHVHAEDDGAAFVDARGAVWLPGSAGGPGPLRRRAELYTLRAELTASARARQEAGAAADAARDDLHAAEQRAAAAAEAAASAQQIARRTEERRGELLRNQERTERDLEQARLLAQRLAERRDAIEARRVVVEARISESRGVLAERELAVSAARTRLVEAERSQEEARERRTRGQIEQAQRHARLQVAADRERRLAEEEGTATTRLGALSEELSGLTQADSALAQQVAGWQLELETRQGTLADGEARLAGAESAVQDADAALTAADHALDDYRHRGAALAEALHQAELRFTELSGRRTAIRERLETEWRRSLEDMLASIEPVDVDDETLRAESDALRQQLEALGPVNPLAIEEHEDEVKRLDFLTTQRNDLAAARLSLQQAIREIDATARELFLETFAQVRENFRQIFMTLFGGGECDLRLENPEAPLDCDIEIHASPRGKRTQRIHLLSSGERALVALSLLFGIFLTKPSPFCLLDEVDAPLDDANIGRFVRMLNQFKTRTQFIVITHNPRTTTDAADAVYGVTMQEPGVSSLVSVRMRPERAVEAGPPPDAGVEAVSASA
ncbi:MAG TPA: chromosome segregation protein SMC [Gemmatimonadaceae bacterium]|nr:chromosome segregation protein SMC [Gemmatimonadaceae bacterium]